MATAPTGTSSGMTLDDTLFEELMELAEEFTLDRNLSEDELVLLRYPLQKYKLEKIIEELNTIADQVDATHKKLTKTSLVASSSGAVSAAMTILGVALAPVTGGGSLMLSAAGQGLGVAAAVTNIFINVLENRSDSAARDRAGRLVVIPTTLESKDIGGAAGVCVQKCVDVVRSIRQLHAYKMAQANCGFMAKVRNFVTTGRVPFWRSREVQRAVKGPALTVTSGARMMGVAGAGYFLVQDVKSFLQNYKHLEEGARAETAEELRTLVQELEEELSWLTKRYELAVNRHLQAGL
ncbi:apolipoprotein L5 isoform 1-T2 [Hipposideros larvatus]